MSPYRPHESERQHRHDDQRLRIGTQGQGQQREYREQGHEKQRSDRGDRFLLLAGAFDGEGNAVVAAQHLAQETDVQFGHDGFRGSDPGIHFSRIVDAARPVGTLDFRQASPAAHFGHRCERHFPARRRPDPERVKRIERAPLLIGVTHHQADVVPATLYSLGLFAVESLPHLAAQVGQGYPQGFSGRSDGEFQFRLAVAQGIGDAVHARVLKKFAAKLVGDASQVADVLAREPDPYFRIPFDPLRNEVELVRSGKGTRGFAPHPAHFLGPDVALLARVQLYSDFTEMRSGRGRNGAAGLRRGRVSSHGFDHVQHDRLSLLFGQLLPQVPGGIRKSLDDPLRGGLAGPQGHPQAGGDRVSLYRREKRERQVPTENNADRDDQGRQRNGQRQDTVPVCGAGQVAETALDKRLQRRFEHDLHARETGPQPAEPAGYVSRIDQRDAADGDAEGGTQIGRDRKRADHDGRQNGHPELAQRHPCPAVSEMRRQDHLAFDQGKGKAADDGAGDDAEYLPDPPDGKQQRREGRHGGQNAERDRNHDLLRSLNRSGKLTGSPPVRDIGALSHHNGIVHQHAESEDEADHRDGVDRKAERIHEEKGAEEGDGNACRHPKREVGAQEQGQQEQYQQKALDAAVHQGPQAAGHEFGFVLPYLHLHPFGIPGRGPGDKVLDGLGDQANVLLAHSADLHQCGRPVVEREALAGVCEAVHDPGDVLHEHPGAVVTGGHQQVLYFTAPIGLAAGTQQHFAFAGLHGAARQVQRTLAQRVGHVVEGQVVARQRQLGDFDGYFVRPRIGDFGMRDAVKSQDVVAHAPRHFLERAFVGGAGNGNLHDHARRRDELNDRLFRFLRKRIDGVDLRIDIVQHQEPVGVVEELHHDIASALRRGRTHFLDAVDALDPLLDPGADPGLHLLGSGAQVRNGDGNDRQVEVGIEFDRNLAERCKAGQNGKSHQEVGRHPVGGEPGDHRLHPGAAGAGGAGAGRTLWPSTASSRPVTQICSPSATSTRR